MLLIRRPLPPVVLVRRVGLLLVAGLLLSACAAPAMPGPAMPEPAAQPASLGSPRLVRDLNLTPLATSIREPNGFAFSADDGVHGAELWRLSLDGH